MAVYTKLIHQLFENIDKNNIPKKMDLVLDSGAFNGMYMYGTLLYIKELENKKFTTIDRISGSSVGALLGCFYALNKLHVFEEIYHELRETVNNTIQLAHINPIIEREINKIGKNAYQLVNNKLHINYIDIQLKKEIIVSTFTNNDDLLDKLNKSTFIPILTNNDLTYKNCVDATCPHIFPERIIGNHILFIDIWKIGTLKTMLKTVKDVNLVGRTFEGIMDIQEFFFKNTPSQMCSYVNDWNIIHYTKFRIRELLWLLCVYIIHLLIECNKYIPDQIKTSLYTSTIHDFSLKCIKDIICCFIAK